MTQNLESLLKIISQTGHNEYLGATIIQALRDNPDLALTPTGKKAMRQCQKYINGTSWEKVLYPDIETPERQEQSRRLKPILSELDGYVYMSLGPLKHMGRALDELLMEQEMRKRY